MIHATFARPKLTASSLMGVFTCGVVAIAIAVFPVQASNEATVVATVTVENISVSVDSGVVSYGILGLNDTAGTHSSDTQTATNEGNVPATILIKGQDTAAWTLGTTAGVNTYVHQFCTSDCATPTTNYTPLTLNNQELVSNLSAAGQETFDLFINTPTSSSSFSEQSVDVTVTATSAQ